MNLSTGMKISPNQVFELPVTDEAHVEAMAEAQGRKS